MLLHLAKHIIIVASADANAAARPSPHVGPPFKPEPGNCLIRCIVVAALPPFRAGTHYKITKSDGSVVNTNNDAGVTTAATHPRDLCKHT